MAATRPATRSWRSHCVVMPAFAGVLLLLGSSGCSSDNPSSDPTSLDDEADVQRLFETIGPELAQLLAEGVEEVQQKAYPDCPGGGTVSLNTDRTQVEFEGCTIQGVTINGRASITFSQTSNATTVKLSNSTLTISGLFRGTIIVESATLTWDAPRACWRASGRVRTLLGDLPFNVQSSDQSCRETGTGGTGGMGGTGGSGGEGGNGGMGGALTGTITGEVLDTDDSAGLAGVFVRAVLNDAGVGSDTTDPNGFEISVSEAGDYELCAIGVLAQEHRWVSTDCAGAPEDSATVTESMPNAEQDLNITSGYYLHITNAPLDDIPVGPTTTLTLDYQAWNRLSVPNTTTWIVFGIGGTPQGAYEVGNAGRPPGKTETGVSVFFTPESPGTIFARLVPQGSEQEARDVYEESFSTAETTNYVPIGEVVP